MSQTSRGHTEVTTNLTGEQRKTTSKLITTLQSHFRRIPTKDGETCTRNTNGWAIYIDTAQTDDWRLKELQGFYPLLSKQRSQAHLCSLSHGLEPSHKTGRSEQPIMAKDKPTGNIHPKQPCREQVFWCPLFLNGTILPQW